MRPRRLQSATILSMVTGPATAEQATDAAVSGTSRELHVTNSYFSGYVRFDGRTRPAPDLPPHRVARVARRPRVAARRPRQPEAAAERLRHDTGPGPLPRVPGGPRRKLRGPAPTDPATRDRPPDSACGGWPGYRRPAAHAGPTRHPSRAGSDDGGPSSSKASISTIRTRMRPCSSSRSDDGELPSRCRASSRSRISRSSCGSAIGGRSYPRNHRALIPRGRCRMPFRSRLSGLRRLVATLYGVRVSSPARSWTLRSSAADDADPLCRERRTMRTTWQMPPQVQAVADGPWGTVRASPRVPQL